MPVSLNTAQGSIQALADRNAKDFVAGIAGHAFGQHMSKAAARQAANGDAAKGY